MNGAHLPVREFITQKPSGRPAKPGSATATIGFQLYQEAFVFHHTGFAAAMAIVLFLITVVLSMAQLRISRSISPSQDA